MWMNTLQTTLVKKPCIIRNKSYHFWRHFLECHRPYPSHVLFPIKRIQTTGIERSNNQPSISYLSDRSQWFISWWVFIYVYIIFFFFNIFHLLQFYNYYITFKISILPYLVDDALISMSTDKPVRYTIW